MTNEQYEIIIEALTDKVQNQAKKIDNLETRLLLHDYDIRDLQKKLAEAEGMEKAEAKNNEPV